MNRHNLEFYCVHGVGDDHGEHLMPQWVELAIMQVRMRRPTDIMGEIHSTSQTMPLLRRDFPAGAVKVKLNLDIERTHTLD